MDQREPHFVEATRISRPASLQPAAIRNLACLFGLDVRAALLTILVDLLVFSVDTLSMETLLPLGCVLAALLGVVVYLMQRHYGKDTHRSALIKSLIVAILTFVPVPITPIFSLPAGLLGLFCHSTKPKG